MAAVIVPSSTDRTACPTRGVPVPTSRPALRVIEGGRSPVVRAATYRRRRLVAAVVLVAVLAVGFQVARSAVGIAAGWASPDPVPIEGPVVVVEAQPGDTLWSLARRVHPTGDVRPVVEAIIGERGASGLQVGDDVRVPAG